MTLNGTGFAADYTARTYGMIPHKNGVRIELAGVTSGQLENARRFAEQHGVRDAYDSHAEMLAAVRPDIDNVACANHAHGPYVVEAARCGTPVIVLEKPPVVWPGYPEGRTADAATRLRETMECFAEVLRAVRQGGSKLLYAEDFVYVDGVTGFAELLREAVDRGQGRILYQRGVCAHQGSHAPAYDTPALSGGGALFNKACHPLGPCLYLKQLEGLLRDGVPIRPRQVAGLASQILKHQPADSGRHFRVMQHVEDFARVSVVFEDNTVCEVLGHDLSISGIRNELSLISDFAEYTVRINPNDENELFLPDASAAGDLLFREKLPTSQGTSFPRPRQFRAHGYVQEMEDAVECALRPDRYPRAGAMLAWDTLAVLMAGYLSSERGGALVDVSEYCSQPFSPREMPSNDSLEAVFQRR